MKQRGFYQISDLVPKGMITAVTKACIQKDCCLSAKRTFTTLLGISVYYNNEGNVVVNDHNEQRCEVTCRRCWGSWDVVQTRNGIIVKPVENDLSE